MNVHELTTRKGRTIEIWVLYNPKLRLIVEQKQFRYELREPSKASGLVVVKMKGFYLQPMTVTK